MNVNELRIGNLIFWSDNVQKVISIDADFPETLRCDPLESERNISEFGPIRLTGEWLLKLGFRTRDEYIYTSSVPDFELTKTLGGKFIFDGWKPYPIKYVHQLQNLFFALTREELQIVT